MRKIASDEFAVEEFLFFVECSDGGVIGRIDPCIANHFAAGASKASKKLFFGAFAAVSSAAFLPGMKMSGIGINQNAIHIKDDAEFGMSCHSQVAGVLSCVAVVEWSWCVQRTLWSRGAS